MKLPSLLLAVPLILNAALLFGADDTTRPATTQQMKDKERGKIESDAAKLPSVGSYKLEDVVRLWIRDGRILATTNLANDAAGHVFLMDDSSICTITVQPMRDPTSIHPPISIVFHRDDFRDPGIVYFHSELLCYPLRIHGDTVMTDGSFSIELTDHGVSIGEDGEKTDAETSLRIGNSNSFLFKAPDLATLARRYPSEVNAYLRPTLREFHAESLLSIDPLIAWQVFAADKSPDPQISAKITALLKDLDATSFAQRTSAAEELKKLGRPGAIALMQLDRTKMSAEQNSRLDDILTSYQQLLPEEAKALADQTAFLLECMGSNDAEICRIALNHLTTKVGHELTFDPNASADKRQASLDQLRQKLLPPPATRPGIEPE